jgi:hypothetical protein
MPMSDDNKVSRYFSGEGTDFPNGLAYHKLHARIQSNLPKPSTAARKRGLVKIQVPIDRAGAGPLSHPQSSGFGENRKQKDLGVAPFREERALS